MSVLSRDRAGEYVRRSPQELQVSQDASEQDDSIF